MVKTTKIIPGGIISTDQSTVNDAVSDANPAKSK
jgi:hypothetical protein